MDFTILISNYTTGLANSFGGLAGNSRNPSNDQYDAFRHALVSAELARAGEGFSEFWMSRHEDEVPNDPPEDNMDRWNNKVGRDEYENWREAWTTGQTTDSLAKWIYDKVLEGKTINTPLDPRKYNDLPSPGDKNHNGIPDIHESIDPAAKAANDAAKNWFPRHDPLTLDLDGDGLETTGIAATNPILFDHDGDGIKNGTGWVSADDGFLVLDKNGNGSIDSGRELFGDNTIKSNGQTALDGFDALADLDSNADGKIDSNDTQFANLRLWRDMNQDGISQSNELFTLTALNISSINLTKTANSQTLPNGNQIADLGTFTRTDGSAGGVGAVTGNLADINLAEDTFHRQFPNVLDTTSVATLPDMQGSGKVRDLREAANDSEWSLAA